MDLSEFELSEESYNRRKIRKRAIEYLTPFSNDPRPTHEQWEVLVKLADYVYLTEFSDDSGYIKGDMHFEVIDSFPDDLKKEVVRYFHGGLNYILSAHAEDYDAKRKLGLFGKN